MTASKFAPHVDEGVKRMHAIKICITIFCECLKNTHAHFMSPFWGVQQAANGGLLRDPIVGGVHKKRTRPSWGFHQGCTEPETSLNFRQWSAQNAQTA